MYKEERMNAWNTSFENIQQSYQLFLSIAGKAYREDIRVNSVAYKRDRREQRSEQYLCKKRHRPRSDNVRIYAAFSQFYCSLQNSEHPFSFALICLERWSLAKSIKEWRATMGRTGALRGYMCKHVNLCSYL